MKIDDLNLTQTQIDGFWRYVDKTGECWVWMNSVSARPGIGYGKVAFGGRFYGAHKLAALLGGMEVPEGMYVCHTCDNPLCVRPEHLWIGSPKQNTQDAVLKGRMRRGSTSPNAKLTEDIVKAIRAEYEAGETQVNLAIKYGLHQTNIGRVLRRKTWKHV